MLKLSIVAILIHLTSALLLPPKAEGNLYNRMDYATEQLVHQIYGQHRNVPSKMICASQCQTDNCNVFFYNKELRMCYLADTRGPNVETYIQRDTGNGYISMSMVFFNVFINQQSWLNELNRNSERYFYT